MIVEHNNYNILAEYIRLQNEASNIVQFADVKLDIDTATQGCINISVKIRDSISIRIHKKTNLPYIHKGYHIHKHYVGADKSKDIAFYVNKTINTSYINYSTSIKLDIKNTRTYIVVNAKHKLIAFFYKNDNLMSLCKVAGNNNDIAIISRNGAIDQIKLLASIVDDDFFCGLSQTKKQKDVANIKIIETKETKSNLFICNDKLYLLDMLKTINTNEIYSIDNFIELYDKILQVITINKNLTIDVNNQNLTISSKYTPKQSINIEVNSNFDSSYKRLSNILTTLKSKQIKISSYNDICDNLTLVYDMTLLTGLVTNIVISDNLSFYIGTNKDSLENFLFNITKHILPNVEFSFPENIVRNTNIKRYGNILLNTLSKECYIMLDNEKLYVIDVVGGKSFYM